MTRIPILNLPSPAYFPHVRLLNQEALQIDSEGEGETMITNHRQRDAEEHVGYTLSTPFHAGRAGLGTTTVFEKTEKKTLPKRRIVLHTTREDRPSQFGSCFSGSATRSVGYGGATSPPDQRPRQRKSNVCLPRSATVLHLHSTPSDTFPRWMAVAMVQSTFGPSAELVGPSRGMCCKDKPEEITN